MRFTPLFAYVVLGLALGIALYLAVRSSEAFANPPTLPCNVDSGSLVQDQWYEQNANQGNTGCDHTYVDATVFGGGLALEKGPDQLLFCDSADPKSCTSFQATSDRITKKTKDRVQQFETHLGTLDRDVYQPAQGEFRRADGRLRNTLNKYKQALKKREALIQTAKAYDTRIDTLKRHKNAQEMCMKTNGQYWEDVVASKSGAPSKAHKLTGTDDPLGLSPGVDGYRCWTTGPTKAHIQEKTKVCEKANQTQKQTHTILAKYTQCVPHGCNNAYKVKSGWIDNCNASTKTWTCCIKAKA